MGITYATGRTPRGVRPEENLTTRLWERAESPEAARNAAGGRHEILRFAEGKHWRGLTWAELAGQVRGIAAGLIAVGVQPGDRVALMSGTRMEWTIADLAVLSVGGVTVPLYETSSSEQCSWILSDSGAKAAIAESADQAKHLEQARDQATGLGEIFVIEDGGLDALRERATDETRAQVMERATAVTGADLATIVYTSGTTGNPKGCMLTHGNLLWTSRQAGIILEQVLGEDDATLLFLPLAHVFMRLIQFLFLETDTPMGYARSMGTIVDDLQSLRPTFLLSVPRVFEKIFNNAQRKAEGPKRKVFDLAVSTALEWSAAPRRGLVVNAKHALADKLVYSKLRGAIGGRVNYCVSGGAPLAPHLAHFFHAAGITILEGYGLTETSAPASVNAPDALRIGTVGQPLPGVEIRIDDDGEVLVRGGNVFAGYWGREQETAEVLTDDGWFRTGDLGELDDDGYLTITGRKKEIIVTSGGKNVAPAVLEERLKSNRLVSQAMVVGDDRPFIGALLTLDPEELDAFAKEHGLSGSVAELKDSEPVQAELARAIRHANEVVSRTESIRKTVVLDRDFTPDDGELTPTMKLRRSAIVENFSHEINRLYNR